MNSGPTPTTGPGSTITPVLGDHLGSAYTSDRIPFRVTATLSEVYADNIFASPQKTHDYITRLTVTGEYQLGNLLTVDGNYLDAVYSPSLHLYARFPHENGVDQDVDVLYAHHFSRLTLSLEQIYTSLQSTNASLGGLLTSDVYTTLARADFMYSQKLDLVAVFKQEVDAYDNPTYTDSTEWVGDVYALEKLDPKLSVGVGPRIGFVDIDHAPNQSFQSALGHVIYTPSDKISATVAAGAEVREFEHNKYATKVTPILEGTAIYQPTNTTKVQLDAESHRVVSHGQVGQDYTAIVVSLGLHQRIVRVIYFGIVAGYENDQYSEVAFQSMGNDTREDNFIYVQPNLSWKPNAGMALALFDKYEEDSSNVGIFTYDANQVGVSFSATY